MITLLLLVRATYIWVLFLAHLPFVVNRTLNATAAERLQHAHKYSTDETNSAQDIYGELVVEKDFLFQPRNVFAIEKLPM